MNVETLHYDRGTKAWSLPMPPLDGDRTLVLCFGAPEIGDDPAPLRELCAAFPRAKVIGCSSAGEIVGTTVRDRSLSVAVARFEKTPLVVVTVAVPSAAASFDAGRDLGKKLWRPDLRGVLVLSEGLGVNGSQLVAGINSVLPDSVVVTGGLSGDGTRFEKTWVAVRDRVERGVVVGVGLYGDHVTIGHGSKGGWDKFGPERVVTRSEGNVLFSLDGKPALALYKEYLGEKAKELPASGLLFPLAMRASAKDDKFLVRTLLAVDHEKQTMTFAGDVPKGYLVQLMKANFDRLVDGAATAASLAGSPSQGSDRASLAVAISCVGRRIVLGDRVEEEVEAALDALPRGAKLTGFYSYGEISPYASGHCDLHNQTMTLTVIGESATPVARRTTPSDAPTLTKPAAPPSTAPRPAAAAPAVPPASARSTSSAPLALPVLSEPPPTKRVERSAEEGSAPRAPPRARASVIREAAPPGAGSAGASYDVRRIGEILVVRIAGRLTEAWKGAQIGKKLEGRVLFDLSAVERITSFGVREWLEMMKAAEGRARAIHLGRCSEPVISQASMIKNFTGGGKILSFWAPYRCDACSASFERLLDCERDAAAIAAAEAPPASCPRCAGALSFDDDAQSYFGFVAQHGESAAPAEVREALEELAELTEPAIAEPVQKAVEGDVTRVRVAAKLDAGLRWGRILDGLEGRVVIDLAAAPGVSPEGVTALEAALRRVAGEASAIRVEGAPRALAERLHAAPIPAVTLASVVLEGRCAPCNASRAAVISIDENAEALRAGRDPRAACKRCGAPLGFEAARESLSRLAPPPAEEAPRSAPPEPDRPAAVPPAEAASAASGPSTATKLVIGALALAVVALLALRGREQAPPAAAPSAALTAAATIASAPAPRATSGAWSKTADLPPPWVERPFVIDGAEVFVVGRGGPAPTDEAALAMARSDAIARLASGMIPELAGSPVHEFVEARRIAADRQRELGEPLARRYLKQVGAVATPERVDAVTRQRDEGVEAFARYKLGKAAFQAAIDAYKQTTSFQGLTVARFHPELEGSIRTEGELVIVATQKSFQAELGMVRPGDVIIDVNGRPVGAVDVFTRTAADEWARTTGGGTLTIQIESAGARRAVRILKAREDAP